jgi:hypothetical protein
VRTDGKVVQLNQASGQNKDMDKKQLIQMAGVCNDNKRVYLAA